MVADLLAISKGLHLLQNDLQAIARAHRIGQTKPVKVGGQPCRCEICLTMADHWTQVYRLVCQGSVEDQMLERIRRKLFLSVKVMSANTTATDDADHNSGLKTNELLSILRKGSSAISGAGNGLSLSQFLTASIETILQANALLGESHPQEVRNVARVLAYHAIGSLRVWALELHGAGGHEHVVTHEDVRAIVGS